MVISNNIKILKIPLDPVQHLQGHVESPGIDFRVMQQQGCLTDNETRIGFQKMQGQQLALLTLGIGVQQHLD